MRLFISSITVPSGSCLRVVPSAHRLHVSIPTLPKNNPASNAIEAFSGVVLKKSLHILLFALLLLQSADHSNAERSHRLRSKLMMEGKVKIGYLRAKRMQVAKESGRPHNCYRCIDREVTSSQMC